MSARASMTMRATILRDVSTSKDGYGQPSPIWQIVADGVHCRVWAGGGGRETSYGDERTVTTDAPGMVVPLGTDIMAHDRVSSVRDRMGNELFAGLVVDSVVRRADHLAVRLLLHG